MIKCLSLKIRSNGCISVFHNSGQFSHIIGKGQLGWAGWPYDVTVNTNNQLLVADYDNHCIYWMVTEGTAGSTELSM